MAGGGPFEQTAADPGGTTIVVPDTGGGGAVADPARQPKKTRQLKQMIAHRASPDLLQSHCTDIIAPLMSICRFNYARWSRAVFTATKRSNCSARRKTPVQSASSDLVG